MTRKKDFQGNATIVREDGGERRWDLRASNTRCTCHCTWTKHTTHSLPKVLGKALTFNGTCRPVYDSQTQIDQSLRGKKEIRKKILGHGAFEPCSGCQKKYMAWIHLLVKKAFILEVCARGQGSRVKAPTNPWQP
jgi:hypothetical protein